LPSYDHDFATIRLISEILTLYYLEEKNQSEIAALLGLSTAKVNRLLKQARELGYVEINIHTPFMHLVELERDLKRVYGLPEAFIIPSLPNASNMLHDVGRAAADYLLQHLRDGDTICISGGKTIHAMVEALEADRKYDVCVVPATGARQGKLFTNVNYLAGRLAEKLGGVSYQFNAPIFVDSPEERDALLSIRHISQVLDIARQAQIAVVGIGSIIPPLSSYFDLLALPESELNGIKELVEAEDVHGEIFAHVFDGIGQPCMTEYNQRAVGLGLDQLKNIPITIGIAATAEKIRPIHGALQGGYLKMLVTDETTALGVLELRHEKAN
jgi:DNA-binding transcriptional regulator LsrR (DeoR family)